MSSKEIAELTGKEHRNVLRDIRNMLDDLDKDPLSFEQMSSDSYGRPLTVAVLPKDLTLTLVTGSSTVLRNRIINRWQELEAQAATPALPNFSNPAEAARAWALQYERAAQAEQKVIEVSRELGEVSLIAENVVDRWQELEATKSPAKSLTCKGIHTEHGTRKRLNPSFSPHALPLRITLGYL